MTFANVIHLFKLLHNSKVRILNYVWGCGDVPELSIYADFNTFLTFLPFQKQTSHRSSKWDSVDFCIKIIIKARIHD